MRSLGICTGPSILLDHLGVFCILCDIPLLVTDEKVYKTARCFYPQLDVHVCLPNELSLPHLATRADVLVSSGKHWAEMFAAFASIDYPHMRFVYCPHGNSDKGRSLMPGSRHPQQDIALIYGEHMFELLKNTGALPSIGHLMRVGNYRYEFYKENQAFYDTLADELVFRHLPKDKKILLYAPTWPNEENPSSLFAHTEQLIEQLGTAFTLLVKWHPRIEEIHPAQTHYIYENYRCHPGVHFIGDFPAIYPLLQRCDGYIGDFSSIGYDFLFFDRPLYFLPPLTQDPNFSPGSLFSCGFTLPPSTFSDLTSYLQNTWEENQKRFHNPRKILYHHTFQNIKKIGSLKTELASVIEKQISIKD